MHTEEDQKWLCRKGTSQFVWIFFSIVVGHTAKCNETHLNACVTCPNMDLSPLSPAAHCGRGEVGSKWSSWQSWSRCSWTSGWSACLHTPWTQWRHTGTELKDMISQSVCVYSHCTLQVSGGLSLCGHLKKLRHYTDVWFQNHVEWFAALKKYQTAPQTKLPLSLNNIRDAQHCSSVDKAAVHELQGWRFGSQFWRQVSLSKTQNP